MIDLATELRERTGRALGVVTAPLFAATSALRHGRTFHPEGRVFRGAVEPLVSRSGPLAALGIRLSGPAIVRLSPALWRAPIERAEVLGLAMRLRVSDVIDAEATASDQDLLFATVRSPLTMLASPFFTDAHDYFANDYWAAAPFDVPELGRVKLRLVPDVPGANGATRDERLTRTVARGDASFTVQVRRTFRAPYMSVARLLLDAEISIDQEALRFSPFRVARGIVPRGLVHAMRRSVYHASQETWAREH